MPSSGLPDSSVDNNPIVFSPLIIGVPNFPTPQPTLAIQVVGNTPNYFQYQISNNNSAANLASSDYVITADNGTDSTHYADFGMNNSGGGTTPWSAANAAYFYSTDNEVDIGALGATGVMNFYAGGGVATPTQKMTMSAAGGVTGVGQTSIIGFLKSANMNVTTDNTIPINVAGAAKYAVTSILVTNASISLTTAAGGVYPAASKGGTPLVAAGQAYSALTTATSLLALTLAAAATNTTYTAANLFLNLTSAQGAGATADIYVFGIPLF
jgi:hypothetical protein